MHFLKWGERRWRGGLFFLLPNLSGPHTPDLLVTSFSNGFTKRSALDTCRPVEGRPDDVCLCLWVSEQNGSSQNWARQDWMLLLQMLWPKEPDWAAFSGCKVQGEDRKQRAGLPLWGEGRKPRTGDERPWLYTQGLPSPPALCYRDVVTNGDSCWVYCTLPLCLLLSSPLALGLDF